MPNPEEIESVSASAEAGEANPIPDEKAKKEEIKLAQRKKREEIRGLENDNRARVTYANRIFCLISVWLISIFSILLFQGFLGKSGCPVEWAFREFRLSGVMHFDLPSEVILAVIGGTTASVLGIFTFVAKYLFPERK